ncbi:Alanine--tRNA ligase [Blyttiomyces sp. JEL0837]|nr:Alanine--tRNA ligase [Blyttiomyces sp. JEL0837]
MFVSVDAEGGKISYATVVSKEHIAKGLKGNEWANVVSGIVGGKSGGKDDSAQGAGSDVSKLMEALKLSDEYAKKFIS